MLNFLLRRMPWDCGDYKSLISGAYFTNDFLLDIQIQWKYSQVPL